jgi:predicted DNA-binding transcriptional regulator YafY
MLNILKEHAGNECIEQSSNKYHRAYRYVGEDKDPLAYMRDAKTVDDLRQYWKFCQDSAGFFPESWLEYFFRDCQDLLDIKKRKNEGEEVLSASLDRVYKNIEYLPSIYTAITNKMVLEINYKPYNEECMKIIFHPHYLKEYNGRWFLFGHAEAHEPENGFNIALDRIQSPPLEKYKIKYIPAPTMFYKNYFKDIVGVTHPGDRVVEKIIVRAHSYNIYKLLETKPIHVSQHIIKPFGTYDDSAYGEFGYSVEVNNEFIGRILQMGAGLEITSPQNVRQLFRERVAQLAGLYNK